MNILALEPYYGGSHKAFLDGWVAQSQHAWTLLTLPDRKWKWRMRHSAITFAEEVERRVRDGESWDAVFCSDMLNLAEFFGLAPLEIKALPAVAYFHENQLTYPVIHEKEYDYHFALSNMTTALAARQTWFNSAYHRDVFLEALESFLRRMPDHKPMGSVDRIRERAEVMPPGIDPFPLRGARAEGPIHILWAARWEHDKAPDVFFEAIEHLETAGVDYRISVIGGGAGRDPLPIFEEAHQKFGHRIADWGYVASREAYREILGRVDVAVSTAEHEFFGIGMVEAVAAGAYPLVPKRLAYPEVIGGEGNDAFLYDPGAADLAARLIELIERRKFGGLWGGGDRGEEMNDRYAWKGLGPRYDDAVEALVSPKKAS
jgi:glycosyltransferase involved in cell wall biosynthesis